MKIFFGDDSAVESYFVIGDTQYDVNFAPVVSEPETEDDADIRKKFLGPTAKEVH